MNTETRPPTHNQHHQDAADTTSSAVARDAPIVHATSSAEDEDEKLDQIFAEIRQLKAIPVYIDDSVNPIEDTFGFYNMAMVQRRKEQLKDLGMVIGVVVVVGLAWTLYF
ncbi:hypothetical protein QBC38DRAFT_459963 [Podospora fimiseda]|uniref:Uncharacterized protein n=1 Tax=Podospora fimiseda TaxID=252190 RepID=A0AAN7BGS6_9PEZI|nr:hypothetical protein QBC38DRAFT_459963 [Podospora fimiseda]